MPTVRGTRRPGAPSGLCRTLYAVLVVLVLGTVALAAPWPVVAETAKSPAVAAWTLGAGAATAESSASAVSLPAEEQADRLAMDFEVQADGAVVVTETITWRFPEGEERHGILRNVKVRAGYKESETQYRYYELTGVSVTSPSGAGPPERDRARRSDPGSVLPRRARLDRDV